MTKEELDRINRAEEIQLYTENRCKALEKENAELKLKLEALEGQTPWKDIKDKSEITGQLTKAKEIIKNLMKFAEIDCREYEKEYKEAEQFVKE